MSGRVNNSKNEQIWTDKNIDAAAQVYAVGSGKKETSDVWSTLRRMTAATITPRGTVIRPSNFKERSESVFFFEINQCAWHSDSV